MEVLRATQTFPESGLRAAAASRRDGVPDHIRSDNAALRTVAAAQCRCFQAWRAKPLTSFVGAGQNSMSLWFAADQLGRSRDRC